MCQGSMLPCLPRHPFLSSPNWKPSGIPVAVVCDHGAVVSTSFPLRLPGGAPPLRQRALQTSRPPWLVCVRSLGGRPAPPAKSAQSPGALW